MNYCKNNKKLILKINQYKNMKIIDKKMNPLKKIPKKSLND